MIDTHANIRDLKTEGRRQCVVKRFKLNHVSNYIFSTIMTKSFAVFLCGTSVGETLCDLLCCGRVTISVTRVSATSRAAVSSVMSGKSMSMSRDGAVVVGKYHSIEEITSAIIMAAKHCQIPLFSGGGPLWLFPRNQRAEAVICEVTRSVNQDEAELYDIYIFFRKCSSVLLQSSSPTFPIDSLWTRAPVTNSLSFLTARGCIQCSHTVYGLNNPRNSLCGFKNAPHVSLYFDPSHRFYTSSFLYFLFFLMGFY